MDLMITDISGQDLYRVDRYTSFIWTERYSEISDFELLLPMDVNLLSILKKDALLYPVGTTSYMHIESVRVKLDSNNGYMIKIKGRELEALADDRIIDYKAVNVLTFTLDTLLNSLIRYSFSDMIPNRKTDQIRPYIHMRMDNITTANNQISLADAYDLIGKSLSTGLKELMTSRGMGFRTNMYPGIFEFYKGFDRSVDQNKNAVVIFSPSHDNIISFDYEFHTRLPYTHVYVDGHRNEDPALNKWIGLSKNQSSNYYKGILRREVIIDGSSVPKVGTKGGPRIESEYENQLENLAYKHLPIKVSQEDFELQVRSTNEFKFAYGSDGDYYLGDIVTLAAPYGISGNARITAMTHSYTQSGIEEYPTLTSV